MQTKRHFIITIDTEGDNLWAAPRHMTTRNARYLPRFQTLCERFGFKPVYLTDYEMALDPYYVEFAKELLVRNTAEVGMHLHAWNTPPIEPLTKDDDRYMPFLIEYPQKAIAAKIAFMTELLEKTFARKMLSHRSGRWSTNSAIVKALQANGYKVDCSVTPHVSWKKTTGDPTGAGGTDFSKFPGEAYFIAINDMSKPGNSGILEVPMTILPEVKGSILNKLKKVPVAARIVNNMALSQYVPPRWLRPNGNNLKQLLEVVNICAGGPGDYMMFMLHSSEFMPGGSPTFDTEEKIETLYEHLEILFAEIAGKQYAGATLKDYYALKTLPGNH